MHLSKSILEPIGEDIRIDLNIFCEGKYEKYIAEYYVMQDEGEEISGACLNSKMKEETILAVEEAVITALMKKYGEDQ